MNRALSILPFRLGATASMPLGSDSLEFYRSTAEAATDTACEVSPNESALTIPLDISVLSDRPSDIKSCLGAALAGISTPDIVLLDLANPPSAVERGQFEAQVALALEAAFADWEGRSANPLVILLRPELAPEGDVFRLIADPRIKKHQLVVIGDDGSLLCAESNRPRSFSNDKYRVMLAKLRGDPLELLRLKLIRRLGHFKREIDGRHARCVRFFFDASQAAPEIKQLFVNVLLDEQDLNSPLTVLVDQQWADWIKQPIASACLDNGVVWDAISNDKLPTGLMLQSNRVLLVTPLVDSGTSLRRILGALRSRFPECVVSVFAVLSTEGNEERLGIRVLKGPDLQVSISYLLRVVQRSFGPGECPLCSMAIPEDDPMHDEYLMLRSVDFWDMVQEAGVGPERNVPDGRPGKPVVPQFQDVVRDHGAWLVAKVAALIERATERKAKHLTVVCPAHEDASAALTERLALITGASVIPVFRDDIHAIARTTGLAANQEWARLEAERPDWYRRFQSVLGSEVVVFDEFIETGATIRGLRKIAAHFGKVVHCVVCLANFRPGIRDELPCPCYPLYEWDSPPLVPGSAH